MRAPKQDRLRHLRGLTLVEVLVALGVFVLALGIALAVFTSIGRAYPSEQARVAATMQLDALVAQFTESAHSSVAIYTPNGCGADPGTGPCPSVRFYGLDSAGHAHFWGWDYSAASKALSQCLAYASSEGACSSPGATIANVLAFSATPQLASSAASRFGLSGVGDVLKSMLGSDPRVIAGNRLMIVNVANTYVERESHLLQSGAPFTAAVLQGTFTPPPLSATQLMANPAPVFFVAVNAPAITVNASETNYAQYEPYLAQPWWYGNNASCARATWNASTAPSDSTTFRAQPVAVGACSFTIASHDQQSNAMQTYVAGPLTAMANDAPASSLTLNVGATGSLGGGKIFDANEPVNGSGNIDQIALDNGCAGMLAYGARGTVAPSTPSSSYAYRHMAVTANAVGTCTFGISDPFGDAPQSVSVTVDSTLTATPSSISIYPAGGSATPTSATIALNEPGYTGAFTVAGNTCGGSVALSQFSGNGPSASITITGVSRVLGCTITFSGINAPPVSVTVVVHADPSPSPTKSPAPITATLCALSYSTIGAYDPHVGCGPDICEHLPDNAGHDACFYQMGNFYRSTNGAYIDTVDSATDPNAPYSQNVAWTPEADVNDTRLVDPGYVDWCTGIQYGPYWLDTEPPWPQYPNIFKDNEGEMYIPTSDSYLIQYKDTFTLSAMPTRYGSFSVQYSDWGFNFGDNCEQNAGWQSFELDINGNVAYVGSIAPDTAVNGGCGFTMPRWLNQGQWFFPTAEDNWALDGTQTLSGTFPASLFVSGTNTLFLKWTHGVFQSGGCHGSITNCNAGLSFSNLTLGGQ